MEEQFLFEQLPFGSDDFAVNPEPRCPCILLLDTSGSMSGRPIAELNEGLKNFKDELLADSIAPKRVEVAIITFGPVKLLTDFKTVSNLDFDPLTTTGDTPMGEAITLGIDILNKRKQEYRTNGIAFYRPWIILITDGAPTDSWTSAARNIKEGEESKSFAFFAIGVSGANMQILQQISVRAPIKLQGHKFKEFFVWLSASMKSVSASVVGTNVKLLPPSGWAEV